MCRAHRGFLALTLPLWLVAALLGTVLPGECGGLLNPGGGKGEDDAGGGQRGFCRQVGHADGDKSSSSCGTESDDVDQDENGPACGMEQGDAAQVAAVRAMADEQCDCATAANHGAYVSCVDAVAAAAVADGSLRPECEDTVISCAAQSTCGRPGFVTCCTTDSTGQTTCSTKSTAALCKAPTGGTASVGSAPSCCDACGAPASSTTTTTPIATTTTTGPVATTTTTTPVATTTTTTPVVTTTTTAPVATTTTTTTPPTTTTTTLAGCCGFSPQPGKLSFTTGIGSGNCGKLLGSAGSDLLDLSCGGLYTGGGGNSVPLPYAVPDMGQSLTKVAACTGTALSLSATTSTDVGGTHPERSCTSKGCLFGPPLPIPNPPTPPTSVCVINSVATDASGTADCSSGASAVSLPLTSTLFLTGDLFPPDAAGSDHCVGGTNPGAVCTANAMCTGGGFCSVGVQVCPICAGDGKCHGGANDGGACTPADSPVTPSFPTSHDCPPPAANNIGSLPIAFALTTGTTTMTAGNYNANAQCTASSQPFNCCTGAGAGTCVGQNNVFCGFCRDSNAKGTGAKTGCFEGDPAAACPHNAACTSGPPTPQPFRCCTGPGTGTCNQPTFKACSVGGVTVAACTDGNGTWPDCEQRDAGAFGPGQSGGQTITETGVPAGPISNTGQPSTLVSIFCIPPTFNPTVDSAGDLPAPGAVALPGTAQLLP